MDDLASSVDPGRPTIGHGSLGTAQSLVQVAPDSQPPHRRAQVLGPGLDAHVERFGGRQQAFGLLPLHPAVLNLLRGVEQMVEIAHESVPLPG